MKEKIGRSIKGEKTLLIDKSVMTNGSFGGITKYQLIEEVEVEGVVSLVLTRRGRDYFRPKIPM